MVTGWVEHILSVKGRLNGYLSRIWIRLHTENRICGELQSGLFDKNAQKKGWAPWSEFESESLPRQGNMIGHYTTRAVIPSMDKYYLTFEVKYIYNFYQNSI